MDTIKIGKFIYKKRKEANLTQSELAEKLFVTDRAVSKWECGRSLPDSSIMLKLCKILNISVNELLIGEKIDTTNNDIAFEKTLIEIVKEKEDADKKLLQIEIVIGVTGTIFLVSMMLIGILSFNYLNLPEWAMLLMIAFGFIIFIILMMFALVIEQKAGYYECKNCKHRYVPSFGQVLMAPHINRSRYMKCPNCGKKTYNKKVLSKNNF